MSSNTESPSSATSKPFQANTKMADAMRADPNLPVVLMRFHIGGCSLCGFEEQDSIAEVAEANGVPLDVLLGAMNE